MPTLNIKGASSVKTYVGGCVTLLIMNLTVLFALLKMQHLISKRNPNISMFTQEAALTETDTYALNSGNNF